MSTEELQLAVSRLVNAKEEVEAIRAEITAAHPEDFERIETLEKEAKGLLTRVQDLLRAGKKTETVLGYTFMVNTPQTTKTDVPGLIERARERAELDHLIEYGVVRFEVVPDQIERLPGSMKAAYSGFLSKEPMTTRVSIPEKLK